MEFYIDSQNVHKAYGKVYRNNYNKSIPLFTLSSPGTRLLILFSPYIPGI